MADTRPAARVLFLAAAAACAANHLFVLSRWGGYGWDEVLQVAAARSFLPRHGLTAPEAYFPDLAAAWYRPIIGWPPAYALVVSGLLRFNSDLWWGVRSLECVAMALFLGCLSAMARTMGIGWGGRAALLAW